MSQPRVIATVREYAELTAAIKRRIVELGVSYDTVNEVAGLPTRFLPKLLGDSDGKRKRVFTPMTLGPVLGAVAVKLLVVVDEQQWLAIRHRLDPNRWPQKRNAYAKMLTRADPVKPQQKRWKGNSAWGVAMAERRATILTPQFLKRRARKAARSRWNKRLLRAAQEHDQT